MCVFNEHLKVCCERCSTLQASREASLDLDEDAYVEKFKPFMMDIVHEWCKGATFLNICKMTDMFEGSIIRFEQTYN